MPKKKTEPVLSAKDKKFLLTMIKRAIMYEMKLKDRKGVWDEEKSTLHGNGAMFEEVILKFIHMYPNVGEADLQKLIKCENDKYSSWVAKESSETQKAFYQGHVDVIDEIRTIYMICYGGPTT